MLPPLGLSSKCDLHIHTNRSDGRLSSEVILDRAINCGLDIIALTDHDLATSVSVGVHRRGDKSVFVIGGAEMTGVHEGQEFHLLVYFPREVPPEFLKLTGRQVKERRMRYSKAVHNLSLSNLAAADHFTQQGTEALTRHHLARSMVSAGHARSLSHAFSVMAMKGCVPQMSLPFVECIRAASAVGGVTSWAHPPVPAVKKHIATFAKAGLHGIEALRPGVGGTARKTYKKAAKKHGLYLTGGSDWHGWSDPALGLFFVYQREIQPFFEALWKTAA